MRPSSFYANPFEQLKQLALWAQGQMNPYEILVLLAKMVLIEIELPNFEVEEVKETQQSWVKDLALANWVS